MVTITALAGLQHSVPAAYACELLQSWPGPICKEFSNHMACCRWGNVACPRPENNHNCCVLQVLTDLPAVEKMAAAKDLHAFLNKYHKNAYRLVLPCALQCNLPVQMWRMRMLPVADSADGCSTFLVRGLCSNQTEVSAQCLLMMD